jgi:histidinol-phosphate aminotransferase
LIFGHGSNELLAHMGYAFLGSGTEIVVADRAFVVYRMIADLYRARTVAVPMRDLTHDLEAMADAVTPRTRLVFVANPNNPTGTAVDPAAIDRFMARMPDSVTVVFDEAYVELLDPARQPDTLRWVREGRPVFVLRTFSKTYGLAGLRIGYAIGPEEGIEALDRVRQPFNVSAMAQEAALAALDDEAHVVRTRRMVARGLRQLERGLRDLGVDYTPSVVNFMLVRTGEGRRVFQDLQRRRVIVRPMDGYGMPDRIRVTVGTPRENRLFLAALESVLLERKSS